MRKDQADAIESAFKDGLIFGSDYTPRDATVEQVMARRMGAAIRSQWPSKSYGYRAIRKAVQDELDCRAESAEKAKTHRAEAMRAEYV